MLLCEGPSKLQDFLDRLNGNVGRFSMSFSPLKCKVLLRYWIGSKPHLVLAGNKLGLRG